MSRATQEHPRAFQDFEYRAFTFYGPTFQTVFLSIQVSHWSPTTPGKINLAGLGCSLFARHYWGNRFRFLFLWLLRCFTSPGIAYPSLFYSGWNDSILLESGYPIRKSPGHSLCAAIRSLSQLITSFIACWHQGIHSMPLTA